MNIKMLMPFLIICIAVSVFSGCGNPEISVMPPENSVVAETESDSEQDVLPVKFRDIDDALKYEQYAGKKVKIKGYMSSLSPLDGSFIYLMNIPYQSCPFCQPNTTTIVNTVAVYAPKGKRIDFYDGPIEITGTVEVVYTEDEFGYFYPFRIIDASYTKLDTSQLSENAKMYGALSQDGVINDIMGVNTQLAYNIFFGAYDDITEADVSAIDASEFDNIIKRITAVSKTDYAELISILEEYKAYNSIVNKNLETQEYSMNHTDEIVNQYYYLTDTLTAWLNKFDI